MSIHSQIIFQYLFSIHRCHVDLQKIIEVVDKRRARTGRGLADVDWPARVSTAYINSKLTDIQT
jgi:hypothetical protein